jgi:creatinine amidohydrolase/Fe(II)-dependent formamide hydrolase-like protein
VAGSEADGTGRPEPDIEIDKRGVHGNRMLKITQQGVCMRRLVILFALVILTAVGAVPAFGQTSVYVEDMTWIEVRDAIKAGKTTIIIPTGGTEDFGPHMAISAHTAIARHIAGEVAKGLGNALVAPALPWVPDGDIDPPTGHMRQSGSMTLPDPYFQGVIASAAESFKHHGFTDIVLIGDHGGQQASLKAVAAVLNKKWAGTRARAHFASEYYGSMKTYEEWLATQGEKKEAIGPQDGISQTSEMLVIRPDLLHKDRYMLKGYERRAEDADPTNSSIAYGRKGIEMRTEATVKQIKALIAAK